jgi:hypothetical protein
MKTEQHHKADENLLSRTWADIVQRFRGPQSRTYWLVLSVVVLVAVLVGLFTWFSLTSTASASELWTQLDRAASDRELEDFAKNHPGTEQAQLAQLKRARRLMAGVDGLGATTRRTAVEQVQQARDAYAKLADDDSTKPELRQQALLGAGKASETLGDLDGAKKYYERLANDKPETAVVAEGRERKALLDDAAKSGEPPLTPGERMRSLADEYAKQ